MRTASNAESEASAYSEDIFADSPMPRMGEDSPHAAPLLQVLDPSSVIAAQVSGLVLHVQDVIMLLLTMRSVGAVGVLWVALVFGRYIHVRE